MSSGWVDESATGSVNFLEDDRRRKHELLARSEISILRASIVFLTAASRVHRALYRVAPGPSPLPPSRFSRPAPFKTGGSEAKSYT
jgi:hypothetical protein